MENHGQPDQTLSLSTQQAAQQLGVDSRTIRRYITEGIQTTGGAMLHLQARQVRRNRGPEWQIDQTDLEAFKQRRDQQATSGEVVEPRPQENLALHILAAELERRSVEAERYAAALADAQQTIERLAYEAGRQAGRNEELERECAALRVRVSQLDSFWPGKTLHRIQLVHYDDEQKPF